MPRVAVHLASLDVGLDEVARCAALLDPGERERAARFRFERDRLRFVVRRGRLREWLGAAVEERPERLAYREGPFGKPALAGGPCFSLSHSADRMMVAIGAVPLGCDIEAIDPAAEWRSLARALFAPRERELLAALPEHDGRRAFYACWARKEAFVKAIGQGLSYPLDAFEVAVEREAALLAGGDGWRIAAIDAGAGFAGALVVRDDGTPVSVDVADHAHATAMAAAV